MDALILLASVVLGIAGALLLARWSLSLVVDLIPLKKR
jgi:hypothetical protein